MVLTKDSKAVISKEPSSPLLRLLGNEVNPSIFMLIQHGTTSSLADEQTHVHRQVLRRMNEDRPYFEARGAWKEVNSEVDYHGP